ncbi:ABC transporter ATP-binding protein [Arthrobacter cupressi]|uniref:Oligopeptide/dipeptide ABC transporter, ATP-binding protein, C-terminal domain-containing protein n=1 Tax=Arthrobacter cupressi TaxID=1045773 RepID=A0A1G8HRZ0_9MICC|nr:dipeptide ABC transporter ATP-binding protein [Arthrobacter cupressi]NYD78792.1 peptide/nickel transport system ATP-binding protein [Arthrobacter cupressi]SDI09447.1 oligopeptide/dipeptide ABC transporter, ATP-binding protein, C-terminal domain-containing protein [Arthrobacter cupressi]
MEQHAILQVENLQKHFPIKSGLLAPGGKRTVKAVDGVSFSLERGKTLGLVGESGCGKSTTGRMIARLMDPTAGRIMVDGVDISQLRGKDLYHFRRKVQMIFQDPFASLNPRQSIGTAIAAPMVAQKITPPGGLKNRVKELLEQVGLKAEHYNRFPHEFSGGQRQRVGIARAISLNPSVIVCDEPVSALDVSVQAQVVNLLQEIQQDTGVSYIFIAHDLSVVRHISDEVAVMYLGKMVEQGSRDELFAGPRHPYTRALLSAVPLPDPRQARAQEKIRLRGDLPSPANPPSGCVFRTRCPLFGTLGEEQRQLCIDVVPAPAVAGSPACHHTALAGPLAAGVQ